jgi:hypothetical protein
MRWLAVLVREADRGDARDHLGVNLIRQMVDNAPEAIWADLSAYTEAIGKLSEMYAEYGSDQAEVWENADYDTFFREYAVLTR